MLGFFYFDKHFFVFRIALLKELESVGGGGVGGGGVGGCGGQTAQGEEVYEVKIREGSKVY